MNSHCERNQVYMIHPGLSVTAKRTAMCFGSRGLSRCLWNHRWHVAIGTQATDRPTRSTTVIIPEE